MKKKISSIIFLILSALTLIYAAVFTASESIALQKEYDKIAAIPGASGADYLGVHITYALILRFLFGLCVLGLIFSFISCKCAQNKAVKVAAFIFVLLFTAAILGCILMLVI